jgi:lysozyme
MDSKPIFQAVRQILGRGFRAAEIAALDAAIKAALDACIPATAREIGPAGIDLIQKWEGCAKARPDGLIEAYPDPGTGGDPWTIGWGSTGAEVAPGVIWTKDQCDARLKRDLTRYSREVATAIGDAPTAQGQFDALVSFHYNTGAIGKATLTKLHRGGHFAGAQAEFGKWINAGGRVMPGLVKRRAEEARLYADQNTHLNDST